MKKILSFILMTVATLNSVAQTEVNAYAQAMGEGVTYYLPRTVINITVEARCVTRTPGEFARYAERFMRINDAIVEENKFWELDGVTVKSTGTPDAQKMFTVKLNGSSASNVQLDENGILQAINTKAEEKTEAAKSTPAKKRVDAKRYMTEEILQATSTAKMAELTAKEIYAIRESKMGITRGTADNMPKDGLSMQLILDELDTQENALTELFTGRSDTVRYTCDIKFTPTADSDTTRAVLFRFSRKLGILGNDNLAGNPVYYDFSNCNSIAPPDENSKKKPIKKEGICYNLPGQALLRIYTAGETLFEEELPIAQLGSVEVLSKALFNKNNKTKVLFDTATGNIEEIDK